MTCDGEKTRHGKSGRSFPVLACTRADYSRLLEMYDSFFPEAEAQGLPPCDRDARVKWLRRLVEIGENFAVPRHGKLIGHAALIPSDAGNDAEYLIFVGRPYRKRGVGSELTRAALQRANELGLHGVWVTVGAANFKAIMLFKKFGFQFCDKGEWERKMAVGV